MISSRISFDRTLYKGVVFLSSDNNNNWVSQSILEMFLLINTRQRALQPGMGNTFNRRCLVNSFCVPKLFEIAEKSSHFIWCINPVVVSYMMKYLYAWDIQCSIYLWTIIHKLFIVSFNMVLEKGIWMTVIYAWIRTHGIFNLYNFFYSFYVMKYNIFMFMSGVFLLLALYVYSQEFSPASGKLREAL